MKPEILILIAAGLASVAVFWALPRRHAQTGVAAVSLAVVAWLYPAAGVYLWSSILLVNLVTVLFDPAPVRGPAALAASILLGTAFLILRDVPLGPAGPIALLGSAYFTLRHIHVLAEWAWGRLEAPTLGELARYHLLLPVLSSGPIHRLPHFNRACLRRRWNAEEFFTGAERALLGAAMVTIIGGVVLGWRLDSMIRSLGVDGFIGVWLISAVDWLRLYVYFAGYTDIALGLCLMMGLTLEENFDRPWRAQSLVEFWTRWHMTLSHWCRDYIYVPLAAATRSPLIGVGSALLALGIWHQTSLYYVAWAVWQTLGIVLTHAYGRLGDPLGLDRWPIWLKVVAAPVAILAWLSAARPVIGLLLGASPA